MATKVGTENNTLQIDDETGNIQYLNAAWCGYRFSTDYVYITDKGRNAAGKEFTILKADFEDLVGGTYVTEATIATYLSNLVG